MTRRYAVALLLASFVPVAFAQQEDPDVWVTDGEPQAYHTRRDCIILRIQNPKDVHTIKKSQIGKLVLCNICRHRDEDK